MARTAAVPTGTARTATTSSCTFPSGTQVFDEEDQLIADLARPESRVVVARGGAGGRGNRRFAGPDAADAALRDGAPRRGSDARAPAEAARGRRARRAPERRQVLAPPADLEREAEGRGLPVHRLRRSSARSTATVRQVIADVPGLIEGASEGIGLGHEFLAHLERARLLLHVIDAADGAPVERFRAIDHELQEYGAGLDRHDRRSS